MNKPFGAKKKGLHLDLKYLMQSALLYSRRSHRLMYMGHVTSSPSAITSQAKTLRYGIQKYYSVTLSMDTPLYL